jgi:N-acetyl-anhydromuramyl-L-alanine amidase AmpD
MPFAADRKDETANIECFASEHDADDKLAARGITSQLRTAAAKEHSRKIDTNLIPVGMKSTEPTATSLLDRRKSRRSSSHNMTSEALVDVPPLAPEARRAYHAGTTYHSNQVSLTAKSISDSLNSKRLALE